MDYHIVQLFVIHTQHFDFYAKYTLNVFLGVLFAFLLQDK